jgi:hypothetical protein
MAALGVPNKKDAATAPRNALTTLAAIMKSNSENLKDVEASKLEFEKEKFEYQKILDDKKVHIQILDFVNIVQFLVMDIFL